MCWYVKHFPDGEIELRPHGGQQEFAEVFAAFASTHAGAAVFCAHDGVGGVTLYLSPRSTEFARMIQAREAARPGLEELMPLPRARLVALDAA